MDYFPIFANLLDRPCLVVGGGEVAARKVRLLLTAGARITVCAQELCDDLRTRANAGELEIADGPADRNLISRNLLIVAATSDSGTNAEVAALAAAAQRLCNIVDDGDASSYIMPSVIDRSPLVIAVSSGGHSPVLARWLRQSIEAWLPKNIEMLARWAGGKRRQIQRRITAYRRRLHFWQDVFDGPIADQVLAGNTDAADTAIDNKLADMARNESARGEAWLVGAGPGDPDLITRRGMHLLQRADAVLYDRLVAPELLDLARRDAELINVGKQPGRASVKQREINRLLIERVRAGQRVCRLKGGDPFIFGRGGEEIAALAKAGLAWQVIPGISAAHGCAVASGIPLTYRQVADAVSFVTAHHANHDEQRDDELDWPAMANPRQTLVFYMGVTQFPDLCAKLIHHGRAQDTPAAIIENGTTPQQRVIGGRLESIAAVAERAGVAAPAVLIVGEVVDLAHKPALSPQTSAAEVA